MEDFRNIVGEYKSLQNMVENQTNDLNLIHSKIKTFEKNMSSLKDDIANIQDIENGSFGFLNEFFKKFINNIQKNIVNFNDLVLNQLDSFIYSYKFATTKNLTEFNEIKYDLFEERKNLINKRNDYWNNIDESENELKNKKNNQQNNKKDENVYNNAVKENYHQLYQYELNKMNETIEECNTKYNNIYHEISAINASLKLTVKDCLIKFAKNLNNIADSLNLLSSDITKKIDSLKILNTEEITQSIDRASANNEPRFEKMKYEKKEKKVNKEKEKVHIFEFFKKRLSDSSINDEKKIINKDDTFELVSQERIQNEEQNQKADNKIFIINIIKKIVGEEEVKSKEITTLFNILTMAKNEANNNEKNYADIFLNKIKEQYNHRVISFKNKNNFIHLSNIMNDLCLRHKNNNNIFNLIIEVSQMIKYKNDFIYKIIQKKNEFLSTKTLWLELIDNTLTEDLNKYVDEILSRKTEEKNNLKEIDEKDEKYNYFEKSGLYKKISNYKKLNKIQKKELSQYCNEKIRIILSKSIPGMCCFLVPQKIIEDIIIHYGSLFKFELEIKSYLKNKMTVKNMKVRHQKKYCMDKDEKRYNKIIILSSLSKYYPIEKYPVLFTLNNQMYPKLKQNILLNLLSDEKLSIESHLKLLREILKIEKIKKDFNYQEIKKQVNISVDNGDINEEIKQGKNIFLIEKDVVRTLFIQKNREHIPNLKSILVCFIVTRPDIGYCQGMNCIVSFLYQLLGYDEEETFYFLVGLETNTNFHEIFQDEFQTLNKFFLIFEKILNINRPEIYYKFMDNNIVTNSYSSSWFITLFTDYVFIFDKKSPPKFIFFVFERFILEGWSAVFNCGFTILEYCYEKIMALERDKLITYIMNILDSEEILKDDNYEKVKELYLKNNNLINEFFIEKLIEITQYEEKNKYLNENVYNID